MNQSLPHHPPRQQLRLLYLCLRYFQFHIGWVAVFAEYLLDRNAHFGLHVFAYRPVNACVALDGFYQLAGYVAQDVVAEDGHGTVVHFQGSIKSILPEIQAHVFVFLSASNG